jgi:hypothetical protein
MFYSHFVYQISSIHDIFLRHFILFALFYSVQYSTGKDEHISDYQCSLYFCKIFYYFCYILFIMELVKKNLYQIFNVHYISVRYFIIFVIFCSFMELVKKNLYQIFNVHYISLRYFFKFCHILLSTELVKLYVFVYYVY